MNPSAHLNAGDYVAVAFLVTVEYDPSKPKEGSSSEPSKQYEFGICALTKGATVCNDLRTAK